MAAQGDSKAHKVCRLVGIWVAISACFPVQLPSGSCAPAFLRSHFLALPVLAICGKMSLIVPLLCTWELVNSTLLSINSLWLGMGTWSMTGQWKSWGFLLFQHIYWGSLGKVIKMSIWSVQSACQHFRRWVRSMNTRERQSKTGEGQEKGNV